MAINSRALETARFLRKNMTEAERLLWQELKGGKLAGLKFRRQMPFVFGDYRFVADFYCREKKLIIEIDGGIHDNEENKECDILREDIFRLAGFRILRFKNQEISQLIKEVLEKIIAE